MIKKCVVCGADFYAPPSSKKITCGKACSAIRKRQTHIGHDVTAETRDKISTTRKGVKPPTYDLFVNANKESPKTQRTPMNSAAKQWKIRHIDTGTTYEFINLQQFLRENPELFDTYTDEDVSRAAHGFYTIKRNFLTGKSCITYRGWQIIAYGMMANWENNYELFKEE